MNNELFELCKKVYERTGWDDLADDHPWITERGVIGYKRNGVSPVYDSDYLLDKLPPSVKNEFDGGDDYIILYKKKNWYADYMGQFMRCEADTPLKALLKLVLALPDECISKGATE